MARLFKFLGPRRGFCLHTHERPQRLMLCVPFSLITAVAAAKARLASWPPNTVEQTHDHYRAIPPLRYDAARPPTQGARRTARAGRARARPPCPARRWPRAPRPAPRSPTRPRTARWPHTPSPGHAPRERLTARRMRRCAAASRERRRPGAHAAPAAPPCCPAPAPRAPRRAARLQAGRAARRLSQGRALGAARRAALVRLAAARLWRLRRRPAPRDRLRTGR